LQLTITGPASDGGWSPFPRTETRQAAQLAAVLRTAGESKVTAVSVAALQDTATNPGTGMLRLNGSAKPAALLFSPGANLTAVAQPGVLDLLSGWFYRAAAVLLAVALLLAIRLRHELRRRGPGNMWRRLGQFWRRSRPGPLRRRRRPRLPSAAAGADWDEREPATGAAGDGPAEGGRPGPSG
jgi:hypothetical protein